MGVESQENAVQALRYVKEVLKIDPDIVVSDLSPKILSGTVEVFGEEKIALDPFHVMQNVNRAILKDLRRFRKRRFTAEKQELDQLKHYVCNLQKKTISTNLQEVQALKINDSHEKAQNCLQITKSMLPMLQCLKPKSFFEKLTDRIEDMRVSPELPIKAYALSLKDKLPKNARNLKTMQRLKPEILKKLKTLYRECQQPLKEEQRRFNKTRWALMYQPEHLNSKRAEFLTQFLTKYPELNSYRDLTLSIGSIYRLPNEFVYTKMLDSLPISPEWGNEIQACISTLKRYSASIFRFKGFYAKHKNAPKKCRANMEYQNVKVRHIFGSGNYLKNMNRIQNEMQQQLGGVVRNFISRV